MRHEQKIERNSELPTDETRTGRVTVDAIFEYRTNGVRIAPIIETLERNGPVRGPRVDYYSRQATICVLPYCSLQ